MNKWEVNPFIGNEILERDGFHISFHPMPGGGISGFHGDTAEGETAIVTGDKFYILNGDYRKQYEEAVTLDEAMEVFKANIEHMSSWSNSLDSVN